ncbi:MAG: flagellar motor protein MotB [Synergistaceae bacterium]|nr:flagellar motor protein MotB [Synergistaceae bacterium]
MARKKLEEDRPVSCPLWLGTWGDLVSLLMCFFVLLFALSTIDAQKFEQLAISLRGSLGVMKGGRAQEETMPNPFGGESGLAPGSAPRYEMDIRSVARTVEAYLKSEGLEKSAQLRVDQRGITVSMSDQFMFDSGSAELKSAAKRTLSMIASMVKDIAPAVAVEGHTDSNSLAGGIYRNNWGLSAARAASVVTWLEEDGHYPPNALQIVGYGSTKPIVPNDTAANRSLNRRVDIVFLSQHPK